MWGEKRHAKPFILQLAAHTTPDFVESKDVDWVSFGTNNDYPNYLIKLFNKSAKHNAIVNAKVNYTTGAGWEFENKELVNPKSQAIIENINASGESLNEVSFKADMDLEIFGGFYLLISWGENGTKRPGIKQIDFTKIRSNSDNTEFYYTSKWFDKQGKKLRHPEENEDWKVYKAFDPNKKKGNQIFCYKSYRPSMETYALPEYIGAVEYIETDTLISNHCYNDTKNGFVGNTMINFLNGVPGDDKQEEIEDLMKEKFTGSDGQRILLNFADGKENAAEILHLTPPDIFKRMTDLSKAIEQEILTGHRVTSGMLVGIKTEGQLGGRTEMIDSYELMKNTYIKPKQMILEDVFNYLLSFSGVDPVVLKNAEPISVQFSEATLTIIMTVDELREKIGLPKRETPQSTVVPVEAKFKSDDMGECIKKYMDHGKSREQAIAICISEKEKSRSAHAINTFKKYGKPRSEFEVLKRRFVTFEKLEDAVSNELNLYKQEFQQYSAVERAIIDLLTKDELMTPEQLAKTLKLSQKEVESVIKDLVKSKVLKPGTEKSGDDKIISYKVTEVGQTVIEDKPAKTANIFVKYSYEVIPGMGKPIIEGTRDFCRELIALDLLYDREDIEAISAEVGYNAFEMRGGWMTKKGTEIHIPHCRHLWQQQIVTKK